MEGKSLQIVLALVAFTSIQLISFSSGSYLLVQLDEEAEPKLPEPPKPSEGYGHKHGVDYNPTHSSITQTARQATADSCTLENKIFHTSLIREIYIKLHRRMDICLISKST